VRYKSRADSVFGDARAGRLFERMNADSCTVCRRR